MRDATDRLRRVLWVNAMTSGACGLVCLAAAGPLADVVADDRTGVLRLVGLALVVFALDVALLARARPSRLVAAARALAAVDVAWTLGMVALVAAGVPEGVGVGLVLATGAVTAVLAVLEWAGAAAAAREGAATTLGVAA